MALIMMFSLIAPFATRPVEVFANSPSGLTILPTQMLTLGTTAGRGGVPELVTGTVPHTSAMVSWDLNESFRDMYVLRWFDPAGRRIELTVGHILGSSDASPQMMVNMDIYNRVETPGAASNHEFIYRNIQDPRPLPGTNPTLGSAGNVIYNVFDFAASGFVPIAEIFAGNSAAPAFPNSGLRFSPVAPGAPYRRVNNRARFFDTTLDPSNQVTAISPEAEFLPATLGANNITEDRFGVPLASSPNFGGPGLDSANPAINAEPTLSTIIANQFYSTLTPSFTIRHNQGFSFQYGTTAQNLMTIHFLWQNNTFFLYIDDSLEQGLIYEFELERHSSTVVYFASDFKNVPWRRSNVSAGMGANQRPATITGTGMEFRGNVYYFTGFSQDEHLHSFPFAQGWTHDPAAPAIPDIPAPGGTTLPDITPLSRWGQRILNALPDNDPNFPIRHVDATWGNEGIENISHLEMRGAIGERYRFYYNQNGPFIDEERNNLFEVRPAAHGNGMEIRFAIPHIFDEADDGRFTMLPNEHQGGDPDGRIDLGALIAVRGDAIVNPFSFVLDVDVTRVITGAVDAIVFAQGDAGMGNSHYLLDSGVRLTSPVPHIFVQVTDLASNIVFNQSNIVISRLNQPQIPNFQTSSNEIRLGNNHTFIEFEINDPGIGPGGQVLVTPFTPNTSAFAVGYYSLWTSPTGVPGSFTPVASTRFTGTGTIDPLPFLTPPTITDLEAQRFMQVRLTENPPRVGSTDPFVASQIVRFIAQTREPMVGVPNNFRIGDVVMRPVLVEDADGNLVLNHDHADVSFRADWQIGTREEILRMFRSVDGFTSTSPAGLRIIELEYRINLIDHPHLDFAPTEHPYVIIPIQLMAVASGPLTNPIFNDQTQIFWRNLPPRDLNPSTPPMTITNAVLDLSDLTTGWTQFPQAVQMLTASVPMATEAYHRDRNFHYPDPPFPLTFPLTHHAIVEALNWQNIADPADAANPSRLRPVLNDSSWRSQSASFTLDDLVEPLPPAPVNLSVSVPTVASGPALSVRFEVPISDLNRYLNQMHEFTPYVSTSLYIGAFEGTIRNNFIDVPTNLTNPERSERVVEVPFNPSEPGMSDGYLNLEEIFVTVAGRSINLRDVLRGDIPNVPSVVRITNMPMHGINHLNVEGANRVPVGTGTGQLNPNEIRLILASPTNPSSQVLIEGLDENRRYYMFTDLTVVPFTPDRNTLPGETPTYFERGILAISPFSSLVGETTHGVITTPGPGDVDPAAPTELSYKDLSQTSVTVYWIPVPQVPDVIVEYEIVRIREGLVMTDEVRRNDQMTLWEVLQFMQGRSSEAQAWRGGLNPAAPTESILRIPTATGFRNAITADNVNYRHSSLAGVPVEFDDFNLGPNQLYFYYVRTIQIVLDEHGNPRQELRSSWVELPVTTPPVSAPVRLRQIDGSTRFGHDPLTQVFLAWDVTLMGEFTGDIEERITQFIEDYLGTMFMFEYRIREVGGTWSNPVMLNANQFRNRANISIAADGTFTFRYMYSGLRPGTSYEMQVRLVDVPSNDRSLWSNIVSFTTEFDQAGADRDREVNDWLEFLRTRMEELLRQPFWFAQNTPTRTVMVYRPGEVFAGLLSGTAGTAIPLANTDVGSMTFYLPASIIRDLNAANRGVSTRYSDLDILFAPMFLNPNHNQALMDITHRLNQNRTTYADHFVRIDIERADTEGLFGNPDFSRQTTVSMTLVATNRRFNNLLTWDQHLFRRATTIIDARMSDPVLRQNIWNLLEAGTIPEDMVAYMDTLISGAEQQITRMVDSYLITRGDGILTTTTFDVVGFNASMHLVATNSNETTAVSGFTLRSGQWVRENLIEYYNGRGFVSNSPGTFAFTGAQINIAGGSETAQGGAVTNIVARFGLQDLFGTNVDLGQNANRHMVVGSVARIAGAPHGVDPMTWAANNLNVTMTSRNGEALISRQEAIALVMAVYEARTNTRVSQIMVRNFQNTAGMTLDNRFAQSVRAAFEIGIVSDTTMQPAGQITIGEFLDMLAALGNMIGL